MSQPWPFFKTIKKGTTESEKKFIAADTYSPVQIGISYKVSDELKKLQTLLDAKNGLTVGNVTQELKEYKEELGNFDVLGLVVSSLLVWVDTNPL